MDDTGVPEGNVPGTREETQAYDGLAVMDEIYEAGEEADLSTDPESDELDEDDIQLDLESTLVELLEHVQESVECDEDKLDDIPRVTVPKEFADEAVNFLVSKGTLLFLSHYLLHADEPEDKQRHTVPELLAALGFRLPISVVEDPKYGRQQFEIALQVAIRYTLRHRQRLPKPRTLDEVVAEIEKAKNILVVTGAGISTSLGIPDFRSDNGLYAQLEHLGLADPQEVFDIRLFREDPSIFYSVAAKILPEKGLHSGTPTHKFLKLLHDRNKLLRNYTQNIDNLEQYIGLPHERVVQCHGSFGSAHCISCGYSVPDGEVLFPAIRLGEIPRCPECEKRKTQGKRQQHNESDEEDEDGSYGVLKPDITFFGESLPARFDHMLFDEGDAHNCDLIICIGTSLRVSPVSEIVKVVPRQVPQLYISKTPAKHVTFEVSFLGGCDDVIELLCQKLHWKLDHPMNTRPDDMPDDRYPGGSIESNDGLFRFISDEENVVKDESEQQQQEHDTEHVDAGAEEKQNNTSALQSSSDEPKPTVSNEENHSQVTENTQCTTKTD